MAAAARTAGPETGAAGVLFAAVLLALASLVTWRVLGLGFAGYAATHAPEDASIWRADHALALRRASVLAWERNALEDARALARAAVAANPLDGRAYRALAWSLSRDGVPDAGLAGIAARRWPLDAAAHALLGDHHLRHGDLEAALEHIDALLRVRPATREDLFPLLLRLLVEGGLPASLIDRLGSGPSWRAAFLAHAALHAEAPGPIHRLYQALAAAEVPPRESEVRVWLARLERDGLYMDAWFTWLQSLPPERLEGLGNLYNGSFEWPASGYGFDWRFGRVAGAVVEQAPAGGADGDIALRVAFLYQRVDFRHVSQLLVLPPGEYRLSGRVRLNNLRSDRGLVWQVQCAERRGARIGQSEPFRGLSPWRAFEFSFRVPEEGCPAQWIRLQLDARAAADRFIGGEAWFDALRIQRLR